MPSGLWRATAAACFHIRMRTKPITPFASHKKIESVEGRKSPSDPSEAPHDLNEYYATAERS
jgi:hypothetical protein